MNTSIGLQITFLVYMLLTGLVIAFLYDLIRVSRVLIKTPNIFIYIEDIIFFILIAVIIFWTAFEKNGGKILMFDFAAIFIGIISYIIIVRNKILNILVNIINFINKSILFILKIVFFPFKILFKIFRKPYLVIIWRVKSTNNFLKLQKNRIKNRIKATKLSIFKK